jgi:chromosome segregation ATPase
MTEPEESMIEGADSEGLRARGEEAIGELAEALLDNPIFNSALGTALGAGERALQAQRSAMSALNFAAGSDVERLEHRLRSLSGRLEAVEDRLDEVAAGLAALQQRVARDPAERQ